MLPSINNPISSSFSSPRIDLDNLNLDLYKECAVVKKFYNYFSFVVEREFHMKAPPSAKLVSLLYALVQRTREVMGKVAQQQKNACTINTENDLYGSTEVTRILLNINSAFVRVPSEIHALTSSLLVCILSDGGFECSEDMKDKRIVYCSWGEDAFKPKHVVKRATHSTEFCKKFDELRLNNLLLDFEFIVRGESIRSHKAVLGLSSSFFLEMFKNSSMKEALEGKMTLDRYKSQAMKRAIEFIYTGELVIVEPTLEDHLDLLEIAYDFAFPALLEEIQVYISGYYMTPDQILSIGLIALRHNHLSLIHVCMEKAERVFEDAELDLTAYPLSEKDDLIALGKALKVPALEVAARKMGVDEEVKAVLSVEVVQPEVPTLSLGVQSSARDFGDPNQPQTTYGDCILQ